MTPAHDTYTVALEVGRWQVKCTNPDGIPSFRYWPSFPFRTERQARRAYRRAVRCAARLEARDRAAAALHARLASEVTR